MTSLVLFPAAMAGIHPCWLVNNSHCSLSVDQCTTSRWRKSITSQKWLLDCFSQGLSDLFFFFIFMKCASAERSGGCRCSCLPQCSPAWKRRTSKKPWLTSSKPTRTWCRPAKRYSRHLSLSLNLYLSSSISLKKTLVYHLVECWVSE